MHLIVYCQGFSKAFTSTRVISFRLHWDLGPPLLGEASYLVGSCCKKEFDTELEMVHRQGFGWINGSRILRKVLEPLGLKTTRLMST